MYNIIPLVLISISIFIILIIVVRKFSALANLDVENMPAEKEAKFKEQLATSRLQRNLSKWGSKITKFGRFINEKGAFVFRTGYDKLHEIRKEYVKPEIPETEEDKEIMIKELFFKISDLDDKDDFLEKEKDLIRIIEIDSKNIKAFNSLGELYSENKKYEEAKQAFSHVLKLLPDDDTAKQADVYYDMALIYKSTDENIEALETIKMASKFVPNNPRFLDALLDISIINNEKELAEEALGKLESVNPENGKIEELREKIQKIKQT